MPWWVLPLLFVANFVVSRLLTPKINRATGGDFELPTAEEGKPIPYVFGTQQVAPNIVWWGDVEENCGGDNFCSWWARKHAVICWGPVDAILDLTFDNKSLKAQPRSNWGVLSDPITLSFTPALPLARPIDGQPSKFYVACLKMFGGEQKEGGVAGSGQIAWGTADQGILSLVTQKYGASKASAYPDLCHITFGLASTDSGITGALTNSFHWCNNAPYPKPLLVVVRRCPKPAALGLPGSEHNIDGDANPACVLYEILTNATFGCGVSSSLIDTSTFFAAAQTLYAEGLGISGTIGDVGDAASSIDDILQHIDGVLRLNPSTGLLELKLARADYVVASLDEVNPSNTRGMKISWGLWKETTNEHRVHFSEFVDDGDTLGLRKAVRFSQNLANRQATGGVRARDIQLPYLTKGPIAQLRADQFDRQFSVPLAKVSWTSDRRMFDKMPGDVVKVRHPKYGVADFAVRITRVDYGRLDANEVSVDAVQDVFGIASTTYSDPDDSVWNEPISPPTDTAHKLLLERPYSIPHGWDADRRVLSLVGRAAADYSSYDVRLSEGGGGYYTSAVVDRFTPVGVLTAPYTFSTEDVDATGFTVTDASSLRLLLGRNTDDGGLDRGDNVALIDSSSGQEFVTWKTATPNADGSWTIGGVVRAVLDTPPPAITHPLGAKVYFFVPGMFGDVRATPFPADLVLAAKFLPNNSRGQLAEGSATAANLTTSSRGQDPYPAGRARLTTDTTTYARHQYPTTTVGPTGLVQGWSKRSRTGQLTLKHQSATDQSPAEGDYTVEVLVGGVVKAARTQTGLAAGPADTYTPAERTTDDTDGTKAVQFRITPVNGALTGIPYTTPPVVMTGAGMCAGLYCGGIEA